MKFKGTIKAASTKEATALKLLNWLPRGSALISTSGNMSANGIKAIVHAATGSMVQSGNNPEYYEPTFQSVEDSITNGFALLTANGFQTMAVPFIGGNIFLQRIVKSPNPTAADKKKLAKCIIDSCFKAAKKGAFVLITYPNNSTPTDHALFSSILTKYYPSANQNLLLKNGDITNFSLHHCEVIMNAANMEVTFGGGISRSIGAATGMVQEIDKEAHNDIRAFWAAY